MKVNKELIEIYNIRLLSLFVAVAGFINLLSAARPALSYRLSLISAYIPLELTQTARIITALSGFFLIILAINLWRRKKIAWLLTVLLLVLVSFTHLLKGFDYEESIYSGIIALWLSLSYRQYYASSDLPTIKEGLEIIVIAFLFNLTYVTLGIFFLSHKFQPHPSLFIALENALSIVFLQNTFILPVARSSRFFIESAYLISITTGFYAFFKLFEPILIRQDPTKPDLERARKIIKTDAKTSLARFGLLPDKHYFFRQNSVISYKVSRGTALVLGDPIGPPEEVFAITREFLNLCSKNDWDLVLYQTLPDYLKKYDKLNMSNFSIGSEAIVDLKTFSLEGSQNKKIRNAYNHTLNLGYQTETYTPPLSEEQIQKLKKISDEWLKVKGHKENKFSLGWFEPEYIRKSYVITALGPNKKPCAFVSFLKYSDDRIAIDLMRHTENIENGLMEYLFSCLFLEAKEKKYQFCSLGLGPLSHLDNIEQIMIKNTLKFIYTNISQFYNFKGLYRFKEKFHPTWEPRFLAYPKRANLLNIALALSQAHVFKETKEKVD